MHISSNYLDRFFSILETHYILVPLEVFGSDPYKTLVSTIMSARTNDDTTLAASYRLFAKAPQIKDLNDLTEEEIAKLIFPVGFYKTKAKHLKKTAELITFRYHGQVPSSLKELMTLPGVGQKTANLVFNRAFGNPAIAVDTHVHRITNLLGWVKTQNPAQTEIALKRIVPKRYWTNMNRLFVSLGRQFRSKRKLEEFLQENDLYLNSPK